MKSYVPRPESLWSTRAFRRILAGSCATHGLLVGVLVVAPKSFFASRPPPLPVMIQVVPSAPSAPSPPAAAPPAPAPPTPAPPAPPTRQPRQVVEEAVVIPNQPREKPRPKPPKPAEKPPEPPEPPEKPPEKAPEPPPPNAAELMAALRESAETLDSSSEAAEDASASGTVDAELAAYYRKVKGCLYANWVGAQQFQRRRDLRVRFRVRVGVGGAVESVELVQGSGIRQLDETAERAIYKCSPLDKPPGDTSIIPLTFIPGEL